MPSNIFQEHYVVVSYCMSHEELKSLSNYQKLCVACIFLQNKDLLQSQKISDTLGTYLQSS